MKTKNIGASVRARLLNHARENKLDFQKILIRYALERILYRISISNYVDNFLLKGALLFDLWFDIPHRSTMETRKRGYLRYGFSCSGGYAPLFKKVMAMPEDFVQVKKQAITINKKEIPNTARLDFGRKWQALPSLVATETVPFGRLCVLSDYSKQS